MRAQAWSAYWKSTNKAAIERYIQFYKATRGYGKLLQAVSEIKDSGCVLEVGAGKAHLSQLLRAKGWYTVALDLNLGVVEANAHKVDSYIIGDMCRLPFKKDSFDLVISCGLIEHFDLATIETVIAEMCRVGKSIAVWLPTCGFGWKAIWTVRNLFGANILTQSHSYRKEDIADIFVCSGLNSIRTGDVLFGGILHYIYAYATSSNSSIRSSTPVGNYKRG